MSNREWVYAENVKGLRVNIYFKPSHDIYYASIENPYRHGFELAGPFCQLFNHAKYEGRRLAFELIESHLQRAA